VNQTCLVMFEYVRKFWLCVKNRNMLQWRSIAAGSPPPHFHYFEATSTA
jgi:hypothetical protein